MQPDARGTDEDRADSGQRFTPDEGRVGCMGIDGGGKTLLGRGCGGVDDVCVLRSVVLPTPDMHPMVSHHAPALLFLTLCAAVPGNHTHAQSKRAA